MTESEREVRDYRAVMVAVIAKAEAAGLVEFSPDATSTYWEDVTALGLRVTERGAAWLEERGKDPLSPDSSVVFLAYYGAEVGVPIMREDRLADVETLAEMYRREHGA